MESFLNLTLVRREATLTFARSGGPGGQNVNKVNSKAVLRWDLHGSTALSQDVKQRFLSRFPTMVTKSGEIVISSDESRDQQLNIENCFEKLEHMLREVRYPPKKRKKTTVSKAKKYKRVETKRLRAKIKSNRGRYRGE